MIRTTVLVCLCIALFDAGSDASFERFVSTVRGVSLSHVTAHSLKIRAPSEPQAPEPILPSPAWGMTNPGRTASLGAAAVAALLLALYAFRRQTYTLQWSLAWSAYSISLLLVATEYSSRELGLSMLGVGHFLGVMSALLFVLSADTYRKRIWMDPRLLWGLLFLLIWFALSPVVLGGRSVVVPGYLISAGVLGTAALSYFAVRRRAQLLGAGLLGVTFSLLAISYIWIGIALSRGNSPALVPDELFLVNALLYLFAALGMHLFVFEDMTCELRVANRHLGAAQAELRQLVITDPLTGCYNRRFFDEMIGREQRRHRRYTIPLSVLFVDIDRFKAINDRLGHETGDRVLQGVADFLRRQVREADYVFRWGGDEFVVLISCTLEEALDKSSELKTAFRVSPEARNLPGSIGLSIGCAEMLPEASDVLSFIKEADQRMYEDKAATADGRR